MEALNMRFETPESKNRWDSTLFVIKPDEALPLEDIANALFNTKTAPPNKSTLNVTQV